MLRLRLAGADERPRSHKVLSQIVGLDHYVVKPLRTCRVAGTDSATAGGGAGSSVARQSKRFARVLIADSAGRAAGAQLAAAVSLT